MDKKKLESLLDAMVRSNASTLHLIAGRRSAMRMQGNLVVSDDDIIDPGELEELSRDFLFDDHRARLADGEEVKVLYTSQEGVRFRTVVMRHTDGLSVGFRIIPTATPTIVELGLPPLVRGFTEFRSGIVLVTGFFGSGKSTTLAALVQEASVTRAEHIITIEDPIEFVHDGSRAPVHQREVGIHVDSFPEGIHEACRHGARILVVNELRNFETLDAVLSAAERGALVLTSMHASSVMGAISEVLTMCPAEQRGRTRVRLATCLRVVASQTLLRRSHNNGRVPLLEILINNAAVSRAVRANKLQDLPDIMFKGRGLGMQTTDQGLRSLLQMNLISEEEALYYALDREQVLARRPAIR